jgi:hypothetical protein
VICQFTEPAAAVRSPGAAMKREQHRSFLEQLRQRPHLSLLRRELERRSRPQRGRVSHQNSLTSTISPDSTISVCAGISM